MKLEILKNNSKSCILVYLGYGFTPECLRDFDVGNFSLAAVYDYSDLDFSCLDNLKFDDLHLVAWSMGVWAANLSLSDTTSKSAVAINGTPFGIDEKFGIKDEVFKASIDKFDFEIFKKLCFLNDLSKVNFEFNLNPKFELENIYKNTLNIQKNRIKWDKVIISKKDLIFPNSACEWFSCPKIYIQAPHFPFFKLKSFGEIVEI